MITAIEVFLAILDNLRVLFLIGAILTGIAVVVFLGLWFDAFDSALAPYRSDAEKTRYTEKAASRLRTAQKFMVPLVVCVLVSLIPSIDDIWRVRLGLLKLELSSSENVQKAGEHLEVIVKGLECKHLGKNCEEKKEKK